MLGEVVVDAERVALGVAEVLAHRAAGVGGDVLQRRRLRGRGHDDGGVGHGAGVLEHLHHLGDRGALLADGHVEAEDVLALLVDDRVDADGGLAGAAVADDQLALAAPDRDHGVDGLEARLQRLLHRAPVDHARRVALDRPELLGGDRPLAVDRLPERVHDAADQRLADRHLGDAVGALDGVAFLDLRVVAEEHRADVVRSRFSTSPNDVARELEQLAGHRLLEPVDARDAVADLDDAADLLEVDLRLVARQLALDDLADLSGLDHVVYPLARRSRIRASCPSRLPSTSSCRPRRRSRRAASGRRVSSRTTCLPSAPLEPAGQPAALAVGERHRGAHRARDAAELARRRARGRPRRSPRDGRCGRARRRARGSPGRACAARALGDRRRRRRVGPPT